MNGRAPDAGGGVPSLFAGFDGLPGGSRLIATRTTTQTMSHGGTGASAAMHFDQLKSLALSMGMAASAGAARKNEAESKAQAAAQKQAELEKQLADKQREVRQPLSLPRARLGHALTGARGRGVVAAAAFAQVLKLQDNMVKMQQAQDLLSVKQQGIYTQFQSLQSTMQKNHSKLKIGALPLRPTTRAAPTALAGRCPPAFACACARRGSLPALVTCHTGRSAARRG